MARMKRAQDFNVLQALCDLVIGIEYGTESVALIDVYPGLGLVVPEGR